MSDEELRDIEVEENTERLDLGSYDRSKQRLAEIRQAEADAKREAAEEARRLAEFRSESERNSRGRPPEPGSRPAAPPTKCARRFRRTSPRRLPSTTCGRPNHFRNSRPAHNPPFDSTLAREVEQHETDQDRQHALPRNAGQGQNRADHGDRAPRDVLYV
jgi:hypothetical protein